VAPDGLSKVPSTRVIEALSRLRSSTKELARLLSYVRPYRLLLVASVFDGDCRRKDA
jgi:hypothetical protein